jgi:hypothetical protein
MRPPAACALKMVDPVRFRQRPGNPVAMTIRQLRSASPGVIGCGVSQSNAHRSDGDGFDNSAGFKANRNAIRLAGGR